MIEADALTDFLQTIQLKSAVLGRSKLTAPWGVEIAKPDGAMFYIIQRGDGWLEMDSLEQPVAFTSGDVIVLPHGKGHTLSDDPESPIVSLDDLSFTYPKKGLKSLVYGGGGIETYIIAGYFLFRRHLKKPLLSALPPLIHIKSKRGHVVPLWEMTLQFITNEADAGLPGHQAIVTRLSDVLFIQALRIYLMEQSDEKEGWLPAMIDPDIGPVLGLMLRNPKQAWTVETLAQKAAMSRSAFAKRFREVVGQPPIECLTNWRMYKAAELLSATRNTLKEIAEEVGYGSMAAFSKAFKRWSNMSPGAYREAAIHNPGALP